jgi:hypothetical protein
MKIKGLGRMRWRFVLMPTAPGDMDESRPAWAIPHQ